MGRLTCGDTSTQPTRIQHLHTRILRIHPLHPCPPHVVLCAPSPMGRSGRDVGHQHPLENLSRHLWRELRDRHCCSNAADVRLGIHLCQVARVHADASLCDPQRWFVPFPRHILLCHVRPHRCIETHRSLVEGVICQTDGDTRSCTKPICIMQTASIIGIIFPLTFTSRISPTLVNLLARSTTTFFRSLDDGFVHRSRASSRSSRYPSSRVFCWVDALKTSRLRGSYRRLPLCCSTGCAPRSTFYGTRFSYPSWPHVYDFRGGTSSSGPAHKRSGSPKRTNSSSWEKTCSLIFG